MVIIDTAPTAPGARVAPVAKAKTMEETMDRNQEKELISRGVEIVTAPCGERVRADRLDEHVWRHGCSPDERERRQQERERRCERHEFVMLSHEEATCRHCGAVVFVPDES